MTDIIVYGIPNCDAIKKTMAWFKQEALSVSFHDYKTAGVPANKLKHWINKAGLETILNKRSTTWRELPAATQQKAGNREVAIALMQQHTSLVKRPVIEFGEKLLVGFDEKNMRAIFLQ